MRDEPEELKMWLAVRADLNMAAGKLAAQAGHAFADLYMEALGTEAFAEYSSTQAKIVVSVDNEDELNKVCDLAEHSGIPAIIITDAGRTVFDEPTATVCAFDPARRSELPPFLRHLRIYE